MPQTLDGGGRAGWLPWLLIVLGLVALLATLVVALADRRQEEAAPYPARRSPASRLGFTVPPWTRAWDSTTSVGHARSGTD